MNFSDVAIRIARRIKASLPQKIQDEITNQVRSTVTSSFQEFSEIAEFNPPVERIAANEKVISEAYNYFGSPISSANWFVPYIPVPYYGGIFTIYRFCNHLVSKGVQVRLSVRGCPAYKQAEYVNLIRSTFPYLENVEVFFQNAIDDVSQLPDSDISFATDWPSAYSLLAFNRTKVKYYFIQDYEPLCYATGPIYGIAELTYHFGFIPIVNTKGLYEFYSKRHESKRSIYFNPAVDKHIFHNSNRVAHESLPTRIFYYCRPGAGRNGFTMGVSVLKNIKERWENRVDIVMAGSSMDDPIFERYPGYFNKMGLLPYQSTGDLYRRCHIGLVTMYTPHTSYLPLELMACGVGVVTNKSYSKDWLIQDGLNALYAKAVVSDLEEKIDKLIELPSLRKEISRNAFEYIYSFDWDEELEKLYSFLLMA